MMKTSLSRSVFVVFTLVSCLTRAGSPGFSGQDAFQEGLYLQYTRGDIDGAIDSYGRALLGAGPGEHADQVVLSQLECLGWIGQLKQSKAVIRQLQSESSSIARALDNTRFFPAEMEVVMQVDIASLGLIDAILNLEFDFECGEDEISIKDLLIDSGVSCLDGLKTVAAGFTLTGQDHHLVDHWVVRLEYGHRFFASTSLEDVFGAILSKMCMRDAKGRPSFVRFTRTKIEYQGWELMVFEPKVSGKEVQAPAIVLVKLRDDALLFGDERAVTETLLALDFKTPGLRANQKMWTLASRLPRDSAFWLLLSPQEIANRVRLLRSVIGWAGSVPDIAGVMLSGQWEGDLNIGTTIWTSDSQSAQSLKELAKGAVALLNMSAMAKFKHDKRIGKVLGSLHLEAKDRSIRISASIPAELLLDKK